MESLLEVAISITSFSSLHTANLYDQKGSTNIVLYITSCTCIGSKDVRSSLYRLVNFPIPSPKYYNVMYLAIVISYLYTHLCLVTYKVIY